MTTMENETGNSVYDTLTEFLNYYLTERNVDKMMSMVTEDIYCLGTEEKEIVFNKEDFRNLIKAEIAVLPEPVPFKIKNYHQKNRGNGSWDCFCNVEIIANLAGKKIILSYARLTAGFLEIQGKYMITILHMSEAGPWHDTDREPEKRINFTVQSIYRHLEESVRDSLTGLYNRKGGETLVSQALQTEGQYLFLIMDIDNFKFVNDIYGHHEGDQVLKFVAEQLRQSFRSTDILFRLGGDEFVAFIHPCRSREVIEKKIRNISQKYREEIAEKYPKSRSTLSFGGVCGQTRFSFLELYQMADKILYKIKHTEKGRYEIEEI